MENRNERTASRREPIKQATPLGDWPRPFDELTTAKSSERLRQETKPRVAVRWTVVGVCLGLAIAVLIVTPLALKFSLLDRPTANTATASPPPSTPKELRSPDVHASRMQVNTRLGGGTKRPRPCIPSMKLILSHYERGL
jgi:hypothetical protein